MFPRSMIWRVGSVIALTAVVGVAQTPTGGIKGVVTGEDGRPLPGVSVVVNSRPDRLHAVTRFEAVVPVQANGTFTVSAVPDGAYSVCPIIARADLLPPCNWINEPRATVSNGNMVMVPPIILLPAVDFYVRVNDPKGTRAAAAGKTPGAVLMLSIRAPNGRIFPVPMTKQDANGSDHHLAVPAGTDFVFTAATKGFSLNNAAGQPAGQQNGLNVVSVPINVPKGEAQHMETVTIP